MRASKIAVLSVAGALLAPAAAEAHISLHPNTIPAGASATLQVRVPGEQEGAHVTRVDMLFPPGFTSAIYENVPGWSVKVLMQKVSPPIQTDEGPVSEEVSQVIWSWSGPLGMVNNNQFIQFPVSVAIPGGLAGQALQFKTVQNYSNGQIVHWIDPSLSAEHPAPRINVTTKGGAIQDVAGKEAGPEPGQATGQPVSGAQATRVVASSGGASKALGVVALIVGALGLLLGLGALIAARRGRTVA
ncbi:MAG TPA: YcnI family protein [Solirubrobacteraceae bacterium]|nr:YcnI family protein [Solirubrobacteraceae bacterium]